MTFNRQGPFEIEVAGRIRIISFDHLVAQVED